MPPAFRSFGIVPAAGRSVRMGRPKLLLPWQEGTVIERVVAAWSESLVDQVVVVVAPDDQPLAEVCRQLPCRVVMPSSPPPEMKDSVCCALKWLEQNCQPDPHDAWLVAPADLPLLSTATIDAVLAAYDPAKPTAIVPTHGGRRGHPVLLHWELTPQIFALAKQESLKDLLARCPVREIESPEPACEDLDTPQDYSRLKDRHNP